MADALGRFSGHGSVTADDQITLPGLRSILLAPDGHPKDREAPENISHTRRCQDHGLSPPPSRVTWGPWSVYPKYHPSSHTTGSGTHPEAVGGAPQPGKGRARPTCSPQVTPATFLWMSPCQYTYPDHPPALFPTAPSPGARTEVSRSQACWQFQPVPPYHSAGPPSPTSCLHLH